MFVFFVGFLTILLTYFENIKFYIIGYLIVLFIILLIKKFKKAGKILLISFACFLIVFFSVYLKKYFYFKDLPVNKNKILYNIPYPQKNKYLGTGLIKNTYSYGKYVLEDGKNRNYILYSSKQYNINDVIFLDGNYIAPFTSKNLNFNKKIGFENIKYEFDYNKRQFMKGFYGTIYENNSRIIENKPISNIILKIKSNIYKNVLSAYGDNNNAGLILGMIIGDKSKISENEYDKFIDSGLVHIIAVSGGNIVMLVVFLSFVLFFLPFYIRYGIILIAIVLYSLVCGLDSSVFRAMLMGGISILAIFSGRVTNINRLLGLSFVVMLLINPYFLVYDIGFIFSYSAILGILTFQKIHNFSISKNKIKNFFINKYKEIIVPTIGATLGVFPFMLFFVGKINILGIIGNIIIMPVVPFVMIYGLISSYLINFINWNIIVKIGKNVAEYIYFVSNYFSGNGLYIKINSMFIAFVLIIFFVIIYFCINKLHKNTLKNKNNLTNS